MAKKSLVLARGLKLECAPGLSTYLYALLRVRYEHREAESASDDGRLHLHLRGFVA